MISINELKVAYEKNKTVLSIAKLEINKGDKICILGKSGSGKTTFLNSMYNLIPYEGEIVLDSNSISFVPQNDDLIESFTVKSNVLMAKFGNRLFLKNMYTLFSKNEYAKEIVGKLNILDKYKEKISKLSGGQRQRVMVARSLFEGKSIIIADEPTSALDYYNSRNAISLLIDNCDIIISSIHDINCLDLFNRVLVFEDGVLLKDLRGNEINKNDIEGYFDETKSIG